MIVLDTNVVSELMLRVPNARVVGWLDRQPRPSVWTTAVTVFEVRFGLQIMASGERRTALSRRFEEFLAGMKHQVIAFDTEAAEQASVLLAARKLQGRPRDLRDTMIAGIVLARHAALATRNAAHFDDISAPLVDPWTA
jgi:hypothetical protein